MTVSFGVVISKRSSRNGWSGELAKLNLHHSRLQRMVELRNNGYSREKAPELLELLTASPARTDKILNDISVHQNLLASLQMEKTVLAQTRK
jgi:hypothetical protein